ncbi:SDR family NAD(P)-dependent oxidoreductase [Hydrogenophaga pseudoflava]|uniref:(S)-1-Phenylethanol dehydrogenase n=1 Tax=Hydrogenophaga pseudoflava TaxID=47421 RepID=A0A4P6WVB7_HYDPS|nr:SDR family oxidoreductase [Hydrogenophaga pseudoflava]QBM26108.1 (S)-1-Phenylethanol dehydrogenase [Hydrogenophaga pseudoflava]
MTVRYGLEDRTVLLTGAAGGIGRALARAFAAQGARLLLVDREAAALDALVESLHSHRVHSAVCELGSDAAVADVAAQVGDRFGRLDVLVHNAGTEYPTPVDDASEGATARWAALLDNNVSGMWRLTRSLALELGPRGIRVNAVSPGWVRTAAAMRSLAAMAQEQGKSEAEVEREILSRQAVPVMLTPEDLADTFLFLASDGAAVLTGQCLCPSHGEVML